MRGWRAAMVAVGVAVVSLPVVGPVAPASAAVIGVTTTADVVDPSDGVVSLREAVDAANASPGPDVVVLGSGHTYELSICDNSAPDDDANAAGDLDSSDALTIRSGGSRTDPPATVQQVCTGNDADRFVETDAPLVLQDLELLGFRTGYEGGAVVRSTMDGVGALVLTRVVIDGAVGEGIADLGASSASLDAAVAAVGGSVAITDSAITGTVGGAAVYARGPSTIEGSTISGNDAESALADVGDVGGVYAVGHLVVSDSTIADNVGAEAGGLYVWEGVELTNATISGNRGGSTGGVWGLGGPIVATDSTLTANEGGTESSFGFGGGFYGPVDFDGVTVSGNVSSFLGGGGMLSPQVWDAEVGGPVPYASSIRRSTFSGNQGRVGGAVFTGPDQGEGAAALALVDSTITGNTAELGGGIYTGGPEPSGATLRIEASTVADNTATGPDGGGPAEGDDLYADDHSVTTLAGSAIGSPGALADDCATSGTGTITSDGGNVDVDGTCGLTEADDAAGVGDLVLGPLGDHGGSTATRLPGPGSPLIDQVAAGDAWCSGTDQRGVARPQGPACDAGSVEVVTAPDVTSVAPKVGWTTGGTLVTISGSRFTGATAVRFGPTPATSFTVVDDSTITAVSPARPAGLINVWVDAPGGTSANGWASFFQYETAPPPPTVSSITPKLGSVDGGTVVTISGSGFTGATAVRFGPSHPAASFTIVNDATIVATSPPGSAAWPQPASLVNVWVEAPQGTNANQPSSWFSYRDITGPAPTVGQVSPNHGPAVGGTEVTITGSGFTDVTQVRFATTPATSLTVVDDSTIMAVVPARPPGLVNVWVASPNGTNPNQPSSWFRYD